jgi:hypothetical protein
METEVGSFQLKSEASNDTNLNESLTQCPSDTDQQVKFYQYSVTDCSRVMLKCAMDVQVSNSADQ